MRLRNKKQLPEMTRPPPIPSVAASNAASTSGTTTNPPVSQDSTQSIPSSIIAPELALVGSTTSAQMSSPVHITASTTAQVSQAIPTPGNTSTQGLWDFGTSHRSRPYGMPFSESLHASMPQIFDPGVSVPYRTPQPSLTTAFLAALRQQMDEANHEMVNLVTQQMSAVINLLIRDTNNSYQALSVQMERMANFFGAPPVRNVPVAQNANVRPTENLAEEQINHVPENQAQMAQPQIREEPVRVPIVVNMHQDADQVVMQGRRNNYEGHNNIANVVEALLAQNGFNMGLHRPNFVSALSEYVLETDLPRNWKVPKFTKFAGETNELTVEHIARYLMEAGDIANNDNLKMKYFPSSLTKNAFTWFTTLPPHSIFSWNQWEKAFHEQFYMGQSKISLKELASVRRRTHESIDDYFNRLRLLKARCFTIVPEHELVEMAAGGLDYSV
jgi:hypothetical protein